MLYLARETHRPRASVGDGGGSYVQRLLSCSRRMLQLIRKLFPNPGHYLSTPTGQSQRLPISAEDADVLRLLLGMLVRVEIDGSTMDVCLA